MNELNYSVSVQFLKGLLHDALPFSHSNDLLVRYLDNKCTAVSNNPDRHAALYVRIKFGRKAKAQ